MFPYVASSPIDYIINYTDLKATPLIPFSDPLVVRLEGFNPDLSTDDLDI